ncbi:MAG: hypothetical protein AB7S92_22580 [Parvibaculaceae bacterium]
MDHSAQAAEIALEDLCERLLPAGQERIGWAKMAAILVTARLCEPSSELHIAENWYRRSAPNPTSPKM